MSKKPDYCPEWFDLENYKNITTFSREYWAFSIFVRQMQWRNFIEGEHLQTDANLDYLEQYLITVATEFINEKGNGLCNEINVRDQVVRDSSFLDVASEYGELYIKNALMREAFDNLRCNLNDFMKQEDDGDYSFIIDFLDDDVEKKVEKELEKSTNILAWRTSISIDVSYSDEIIVSKFKEWLKRFRQKDKGLGRRYSEAYIQSLIEFNVLPYIDLHLWQLLKGINFTCAEIADLIFPPSIDNSGTDRTDTVRRVTAKKAIEILKQRSQLFI